MCPTAIKNHGKILLTFSFCKIRIDQTLFELGAGDDYLAQSIALSLKKRIIAIATCLEGSALTRGFPKDTVPFGLPQKPNVPFGKLLIKVVIAISVISLRA